MKIKKLIKKMIFLTKMSNKIYKMNNCNNNSKMDNYNNKTNKKMVKDQELLLGANFILWNLMKMGTQL